MELEFFFYRGGGRADGKYINDIIFGAFFFQSASSVF